MTTETRFTEPGSINIAVGQIPAADIVEVKNVREVAAEIVGILNHRLRHRDTEGISSLFYEDSYWRDHLGLSWDLRTLKGRNSICQFLNSQFSLEQVDLDESSPFRAAQLQSFGGISVIQFFHTFTTKSGRGRGVTRLISVKSEWKIWTMFTSLHELIGFEESVASRRPDGHEQLKGGKNWFKLRTEDLSFDSSDPTVLIIGAGQAGLTLSARLKMLNVKALCIDTCASVGDNWRARYHDLVLHDPVWYDHLPYVPFPANWPVFTPKDKLADFFEAYVKILELNVWMRTQLRESVWDESEKKWTVTLETVGPDGSRRTRVVCPTHIVQATGQSGQKNMPAVSGIKSFIGTILHSSEFTGAEKQENKMSAVVIGACNSAHDICQDLWNNGYNVTMIQRSSTTVVTPSAMAKTTFAGLYAEDGPIVDDADLMAWSMPAELAKTYGQQVTQAQTALDAALLKGLTNAGFQLNHGPNNAGIFMSYLQRGGGYYIDVGASRLIIDGKIRVQSGRGISQILPQGLCLCDGTEIEADLIIFATGYQNMLSQTRHIFGDKVADRVDSVWGFDKEGEIRGMWRQTGHPNFWYMGGNLSLCRYYSKLLALQIKASLEGYQS
ncbi:hypothetical protein BJY01DRAFT_257784 [Aspergillus pseudoustus]|uniref:FAD/NAD(P)-binding domain-containing protein n=1 Tax=Aspergillus pseudoustus TaxID=1810923 RepID=A0ABR4JHP5_9EURO